MKSAQGTRCSERGISLLELAIAIMVIGLIMVPIMEIYTLNQKDKAKIANSQKLVKISQALTQFAQQNKRLPGPSAPYLSLGDAQYGNEWVPPAAVPCAAVTLVTCKSGVATGNGNPREVLFGAVPYRALGLSEEDSYDIYGSKITYAVSRGLTNVTTFDTTRGTIQVINQNGAVMAGGSRPTRNASNRDIVIFALVSHGIDKKGAYQRDGSLNPCTDAGLDQENCYTSSMNGVIRGMQAPLGDGSTNLASGSAQIYNMEPGADYFDDIIEYRSTTLDDFWSASRDPATGNENVFKTIADKVFIGGDRLATNASAAHVSHAQLLVDVNGNMRTQKTSTTSLCDGSVNAGNANFCMRIANITGNRTTNTPNTPTGPALCATTNALMTQLKSTGAASDATWTYALAESKTYATADCDGYVKVISNSQLNTTLCPNGFRGWKTTGEPLCRP